ncbi:flagellar basal body-associated FliL family protein [Pseudogemmobacter sp. W21_MBD1_M6]|uniref:flagellar basal body-associated FliL family protein n=1 Tax=Pseudogemmobacter sp. W21_MBD1_M6 TaxID=3240271 RepID=UPI003F9D260A
MANTEVIDEVPRKRSKLPMIIGLVLALAGGAGGFFAVRSGLLFSTDGHGVEPASETGKNVGILPDIAFVPIDPLIINLGPTARNQTLRFRAELEVVKAHEQEVVAILPRVIDVLNGYLRAVEATELEDPSILIRLRAQMLRRVQIVTGEGRVRDLLVMEFILN